MKVASERKWEWSRLKEMNENEGMIESQLKWGAIRKNVIESWEVNEYEETTKVKKEVNVENWRELEK